MCSLSMFNSFIKPNNKYTLIWAICERRSRAREGFRGLRGYPAWTRTKNNASKGRCVTITPRGKEVQFNGAIFGKAQLRNRIEPRITPKAFGAVLPLHHWYRSGDFIRPFWPRAQFREGRPISAGAAEILGSFRHSSRRCAGSVLALKHARLF